MKVHFVYEDGFTGSFMKTFCSRGDCGGVSIPDNLTLAEVMRDVLPERIYTLWINDDIKLIASCVLSDAVNLSRDMLFSDLEMVGTNNCICIIHTVGGF